MERINGIACTHNLAMVTREDGQTERLPFLSGQYHFDPDLMRVIFTLQTASGERSFSCPYQREAFIEMPDGDRLHLDTDPLGYLAFRSN